MSAKIPATIVTGFLGAGKTTLIRHLLAHSHGKRLALIINEFGDVGVDRELLESCGSEVCRAEDMIELANGCICCTVGEDFIPAMTALISRDEKPDHIVIETSGLALPQPLVRAFNWPEIKSQVTIDGVVTLVDAMALSEGRFAADEMRIDAERRADSMLDHATPLGELFQDQLSAADLVVVNKTDLLQPGGIDSVLDGLRPHLRAGTGIVTARNGEVDPAALLGLGLASEDDLVGRDSLHELEHAGMPHEHDDFDSFSIRLPADIDTAGLLARIEAAIRAHDILRLKGFAAIAGAEARLAVQAVGPRITTWFDRPWRGDEKRETALVVIGQSPLDHQAIAAGLTATG
ncbi:MAG: cobalamin biosynthesis protein CobW [Alphaproteobacteria bacterium]|nr:cobalamin biosynthesis protein CobW [Alphaproteobacteria bacterium]